MNDPVRVRRDNYEKTVERATAEAKGWEILPHEPVYEHGRLRGVTRIGGRKSKPKANLAPAIPTLPLADEPVDEPSDDGDAVAATPEATQ